MSNPVGRPFGKKYSDDEALMRNRIRNRVNYRMKHGIPLDEKDLRDIEKCGVFIAGITPKPPTLSEKQKKRDAVRDKQKNGIPLDEEERLFEDRRFTPKPLTDEDHYQRRRVWNLTYRNKLRAEQGLPLLTLHDVRKNQKKTKERTLPVIEPVKYIMNVEVKKTKTKTKTPVEFEIVDEIEIIELFSIECECFIL